MTSKTYTIRTEADRAALIADIKRVPLGFNVACTRRTRSHEQNDLMWGLLTCFTKQGASIDMNGAKWTGSPDAWKAVMMNALAFPNNMLPTLDGKSFFAEGYRSSKLKVSDMSALIEFIYAEGAERGVDFGKFANTEPQGKAA